MTGSPRTGVPPPPHPHERREPLPWHRPKPVEEDPSAPQSVYAIRASPAYRLAEDDPDFITRPESRGARLQIEYLKADTILADEQIDHTIVVFGSTRIPEPAAARRKCRGAACRRAGRSRRCGDARAAGDGRTHPRQKPLL